MTVKANAKINVSIVLLRLAGQLPRASAGSIPLRPCELYSRSGEKSLNRPETF
jgi:hypothetical protein